MMPRNFLQSLFFAFLQDQIHSDKFFFFRPFRLPAIGKELVDSNAACFDSVLWSVMVKMLVVDPKSRIEATKALPLLCNRLEELEKQLLLDEAKIEDDPDDGDSVPIRSFENIRQQWYDEEVMRLKSNFL
jgi:hypothetical protein